MNTNDALKASIQLERIKRANETPKLEDFSSDALAYAFVTIKKAREEAMDTIAKLRGLGVSDEHPRLAFWINEAETATLWMAQLFNAQRVVNRKEEIQSN